MTLQAQLNAAKQLLGQAQQARAAAGQIQIVWSTDPSQDNHVWAAWQFEGAAKKARDAAYFAADIAQQASGAPAWYAAHAQSVWYAADVTEGWIEQQFTEPSAISDSVSMMKFVQEVDAIVASNGFAQQAIDYAQQALNAMPTFSKLVSWLKPSPPALKIPRALGGSMQPGALRGAGWVASPINAPMRVGTRHGSEQFAGALAVPFAVEVPWDAEEYGGAPAYGLAGLGLVGAKLLGASWIAAGAAGLAVPIAVIMIGNALKHHQVPVQPLS